MVICALSQQVSCNSHIFKKNTLLLCHHDVDRYDSNSYYIKRSLHIIHVIFNPMKVPTSMTVVYQEHRDYSSQLFEESNRWLSWLSTSDSSNLKVVSKDSLLSILGINNQRQHPYSYNSIMRTVAGFFSSQNYEVMIIDVDGKICGLDPNGPHRSVGDSRHSALK